MKNVCVYISLHICRDIYECTDWPSIDFFVQQKQQLIKKNNQIQILKYNDLRYILREQKFTTVKWIVSICNDLSKVCIHSVHSVSFLNSIKNFKKSCKRWVLLNYKKLATIMAVEQLQQRPYGPHSLKYLPRSIYRRKSFR